MKKVYQVVENYFDCLKKGRNNLIDCAQLESRVEAGEKQFVLDIRKKEDYDKGHIKGAFHAEWSEVWDFIEDDVFDKDEKIVVVCYTGQTAGQTVSLLNILGYDACSLKGGMMNGWSKIDMQIEARCSD